MGKSIFSVLIIVIIKLFKCVLVDQTLLQTEITVKPQNNQITPETINFIPQEKSSTVESE